MGYTLRDVLGVKVRHGHCDAQEAPKNAEGGKEFRTVLDGILVEPPKEEVASSAKLEKDKTADEPIPNDCPMTELYEGARYSGDKQNGIQNAAKTRAHDAPVGPAAIVISVGDAG